MIGRSSWRSRRTGHGSSRASAGARGSSGTSGAAGGRNEAWTRSDRSPREDRIEKSKSKNQSDIKANFDSSEAGRHGEVKVVAPVRQLEREDRTPVRREELLLPTDQRIDNLPGS